jgi:hypothetical protein
LGELDEEGVSSSDGQCSVCAGVSGWPLTERDKTTEKDVVVRAGGPKSEMISGIIWVVWSSAEDWIPLETGLG